MERSTFEAANVCLQRIVELIDKLTDSPQVGALKSELAALNKTVGTEYSVNLQCSLEVYDRERKQALPLARTGLTSLSGEMPYQATEELTIERYLALGEVRIVPHDYCPVCWGVWDFKFLQPTCFHCSASLGEDVKVLLDCDVCPSCESGKVASNELVCDHCGCEVDPKFVAWGKVDAYRSMG